MPLPSLLPQFTLAPQIPVSLWERMLWVLPAVCVLCVCAVCVCSEVGLGKVREPACSLGKPKAYGVARLQGLPGELGSEK